MVFRIRRAQKFYSPKRELTRAGNSNSNQPGDRLNRLQMADELLLPNERLDQVGRADAEAALRRAMAGGVLSHGWIIAAPKGAGKATLAYRIARGMLDPAALTDDVSFDVPANARVARLIAQGAHPDLFVAERQWNEKTSRYQTEITVETIRELTQFLSRTPAMGGFRVAIIDTADDLNRNAANALLKALEEPPARALLLLLSEAPGRLIATIRSRCRRIDLRPVPDADIIALLEREGAASGADAEKIAAAAGGRPGYALTLAAGEGAAAIDLAEAFLAARSGEGGVGPIMTALAGKAGEAKWEIFRAVVSERLAQAARLAARGEAAPAPLTGAAPAALLAAWERVSALASRGEALNLDRGQLIAAMACDLREALAEA